MTIFFRPFIIPLIFVLSLLLGCGKESQKIQTDVLVIGGGASGSAAGIQAARNGAKTLLIEPTPWLGPTFPTPISISLIYVTG